MISLPAASQPAEFDLARFSPLEVGNYWEYETTDQRSGNNAYSTTAFVSFEVLPDVEIEDEPHRVIRGRSYRGDGSVIGSTDCAFQMTDHGGMAEEGVLVSQQGPIQGHCFRPVIALWPESQLASLEENATVVVGSATHDVDAVGVYGYEDGDPQVGGDGMQRRGSDIGLIFHQNRLWNQETVGQTTQTYTITFTARLLRAELTTGTYGNTGVAREASESPRPFGLSLAPLYPNPASDAIQIEASGLRSGPVHVEVFDLSGRRVHAEIRAASESDLRYTMHLPPGPSGVYFVRVSDGRGRASIGSFVRLAE